MYQHDSRIYTNKFKNVEYERNPIGKKLSFDCMAHNTLIIKRVKIRSAS